ncbi:peptide ABC transporter substrate-binding protein [Thermoflavimicrobium dichotomicum]|uniref:Oligopeptide transport system substrate-binding protein n=1 Tax=Thermoflavimicrobium dichotomicum TaxID=46223 RepID=A0A1I3LQY0_9BACL|nr:peptide ABC transporter substrate-binding protein [Thermoflavimicrobium dichotomicum]SFI87194.1 oligopeptide transport system substrate-binding protein [Thermoflavimicrobium dichotomicum]
MKKWRAAFLSICASSLLFTACDVTEALDLKEEGGLSKDQTLEITEARMPTQLDPAKFAEINGGNVLNSVQEGLMRIGKDNRPVLGVAEKYEITEDGKVYTFYIRKDAKWSDGKPVTAHDFEYAWKRMLDPEMKAQMAYALHTIKNAREYNLGQVTADQVGIQALDDKTLKVELEKRDSHFLSVVAMPNFVPLRKDIVEKFNEQYAVNSTSMVYNGPFVMESFTPSKIILKKNPTYWDRGSVSLNQVTIHIMKDTAKEIDLYNSGKLDIARLQNFNDAYINSPEYVHAETARLNYLIMNHKKEFFRNENIRFALTLAIDRQAIVKFIKDGSTPAGALVPPSIVVDGKSFRSIAKKDLVTFNRKKAQEYLRKGLAELNLDKPPKLVLLSPDDERRGAALEIKRQLKENLGLEVLIDTPAPDARKVLKKNKKFDLLFEGWTADYNDPSSFINIWHSTSEMNEGGFNSPMLDRIIDSSLNQTDETRKMKDWMKAEQLIVQPGKLAVVIPLYYKGSAFLQKKHVKDFYRHPYGVEYSLKWAYISQDEK